MSLERILNDLDRRVKKQMRAPNKRAIARRIAQLDDYLLGQQDAYRADNARAALGYRAITRKDRGGDGGVYARLATQLEGQTCEHNPYDDTSRTAITILKASHKHYTTRFKEITAYLTHGLHYTDALLCREHLRQDSYVRRRSRTHTPFRKQREKMLAELDEYISACREEMQKARRPTWREHATRWGARAAAACWTATMAYAATPIDWLV